MKPNDSHQKINDLLKKTAEELKSFTPMEIIQFVELMTANLLMSCSKKGDLKHNLKEFMSNVEKLMKRDTRH